MPGAIAYQLVNKTGSQLKLVATVQNPTDWLDAAPTTIAAGAQPSFGSGQNAGPGTIVFGYSMDGSSTVQFWIISSWGGSVLPSVVQFAPSGHSIAVNITGNSEDGYGTTLTYQ
jgi:hypothetical protein